MDEFIIRAALGGAGVAILSGPLGCLLIWQRMVFFGATLAHSALLGIALSILFRLPFGIGVIAVCAGVALLLAAFQRQRRLSQNTVLGIVAHAALAAGIIALSLTAGARVELAAFLFGDILAVGWFDLAWIYAGGAVGLAGLALIWRPLLATVVHEDMARVEGVAVARTQLIFTLLVALVIAIAMKIVGILLIVSLLIIPAAARRLAVTPEGMAAFASLVGVVAVAGGLGASFAADVPAGPAIVIAATGLFAASLALPPKQARRD